MEPVPGALLTDLYQLTIIQAYLESRQTDTAVLEFFVRKLPPQRGFLMAAETRSGARFSGASAVLNGLCPNQGGQPW